MKLELSHDILAKKVYDRISAEEKTLRKVERFIRDRYHFYEGRSNKLRREEINYIAPYLSKVDISAQERFFVEEGIKGQRQRRMVLLGLMGIAFIALLSLTSTFYNYWQTAEALKTEADSLRMKAEEARLEAINQADIATKNLAIAQRERDRADDNLLLAEKQKLIAEANAMAARRNEALALANAQRADSARQDAEVARVAAEEAQQNESIAREKADSLRREAERKALVANLLTAQSLASQSLAIEDDQRLKVLLAREAHCIHQEYKGNPYDANIYNALYQAEKTASSSDRISYSHGQTGAVRAIAFAPSSSRLYTLGSDGQMNVFDQNFKAQMVVKNISGRGMSLAVSPSGAMIAAGGEGAFLSLVPTTDLNAQSAVSVDFAGLLPNHPNDTISDLAFVGENQLLVSFLHARKLVSLALPGREQTLVLEKLPSGLRKIEIAANGEVLAALDEQGQLLLWQREVRGWSAVSHEQEDTYQALCFSPEGARLALGTQGGIVQLLDLDDLFSIQLLATLRGPYQRRQRPPIFPGRQATRFRQPGWYHQNLAPQPGTTCGKAP
jgi:hypothetical protein